MTSRLRIAIAEDERDMREYLQEAVVRLGHEVVVSASTGKQLVDQCRTAKPELVITDIKMGDLDGIDAAQQINQQQPVPIILVSAHHSNNLLSRVGNHNIMAYLIKPISEVDLAASIAIAMERFRNQQALSKEAADLRQALEDRKLIEKAKGIVMKRLQLGEEESFRRLRKIASVQNLKLAEVGRIIVASEEVFHQMEMI